VSIDVLNAVRARTGRVFHATQPDVFTSMSVPVFEAKALHISDVLTMHGRSAKANGGTAVPGATGESLDRFIREYESYELDPTLYPRVERRLNLTPDTILRAVELFPEFYATSPFNYSAMWSYLCREAESVRSTLTPSFVVRNQRDIKRFHRLSVVRFLAWYALSGLPRIARQMRSEKNAAELLNAQGVAQNIADFALTAALGSNSDLRVPSRAWSR
jgi:hypothetical protein